MKGVFKMSYANQWYELKIRVDNACQLLKDILDEYKQLDQVMISLDRIEEIYDILTGYEEE